MLEIWVNEGNRIVSRRRLTQALSDQEVWLEPASLCDGGRDEGIPGNVIRIVPRSCWANRNMAESSNAPGALIASHEPVGAYWMFSASEWRVVRERALFESSKTTVAIVIKDFIL